MKTFRKIFAMPLALMIGFISLLKTAFPFDRKQMFAPHNFTPVRGIMSARADVAGLEKGIQALTAQFAEANADVLAKIEAAVAAAATGQEGADKALKSAEDAIAKVTVVSDDMVALQQEIAAGITNGDENPMSLGEFVVAQEAFKTFANGGSPSLGSKFTVQASTITGQEGSPPENSNVLVRPDRRDGIVPGAFRALRIADLLITIPTSSNAYEFTRELAFTNNAAETAEGAAKPETDLTFELQTVNIRTIAHWIKASKQILADSPAVAAYINTRMLYGVEAREDAQLLNGDGTGQNIDGMTNTGNFVAFTPTSGDTAIDSINRAKYEIITNDYAADGLILNPTDWSVIERLKDSQGKYIVGDPFGTIIPMMWALPVAISNNMTAGKFHMAAYTTTFDHLDRQQTMVELGFVNDDFTKNLVTMRAEKRTALATLRPASARYGDLTL